MPANGDGSVLLPLLHIGASQATCTVREAIAGTTVWASGAFVPGTEGVTAGRPFGSSILLEIGSGSYDFRVQP